MNGQLYLQAAHISRRQSDVLVIKHGRWPIVDRMDAATN